LCKPTTPIPQLNTQYYAGPRLWQLDLSRFDYIVYSFFWYDEFGNLAIVDPYPITQYLNNTVTDGGCACCLQGDMGQLMALKRTRWPHLKVLMGIGPIGDWGKQNTANVLGTKTLMNATATSVAVNQTAKMILDYGFDGLDFDWEWPSSAGQVANSSAMYARVRSQLRAANPTYNYTFVCTMGNANYFASGVGVYDLFFTMTYQYR
jgi:GH18 family chitinase